MNRVSWGIPWKCGHTVPLMHPIVHAATRIQAHNVYTHAHIRKRRKEREVFIAEGSLSLAQFYYRNNVKAASFEAA